MDHWHSAAGGVFVCGSPFTEVSTLAWALAEHPAFWTSSESRFLYRLFGSRAGLERPYLFDVYTTCTEDGAWLRANAVPYAEFLATLGAGINRLFQGRAGRKRWVDNSPENALLLDELLNMFPDACCVGLLQPVRTAAFIETKRHGHLPASHLQELTASNALYTERLVAAAETWPDRVYLLEETELFSRPEAALSDLLDFLGEENNAAVATGFAQRLLRLDMTLSEARDALARFEHTQPAEFVA